MKVSYRFFTILTAALVSGFGLVCTGQQSVLAQTTSTKSINGEVSGATNQTIAVIYKQDDGSGKESEILFEVDETAELVGRDKLRDLQPGDTVLVTYQETITKDENGNELKDRKVTTVKFLKAAPVAEEAPEPEMDPALISE